MRLSSQDKVLLFEQEFVTLILIVALGFVYRAYSATGLFYMCTLLVGFALYFWMVYEEKVHLTGKKHAYFEHTSSYLMIAQTALAIQLVSSLMIWPYASIIALVISIIMYSVSLSRILLFKVVFKAEHKKA